MPRNTAIPLWLGLLSFGLAFGLVWRIWWLAEVCTAAVIALIVIRSFDQDTDYTIAARDIERMERAIRDVPSGRPATGDVLGGVPAFREGV